MLLYLMKKNIKTSRWDHLGLFHLQNCMLVQPLASIHDDCHY
jgi:hypothetical protein